MLQHKGTIKVRIWYVSYLTIVGLQSVVRSLVWHKFSFLFFKFYNLHRVIVHAFDAGWPAVLLSNLTKRNKNNLRARCQLSREIKIICEPVVNCQREKNYGSRCQFVGLYKGGASTVLIMMTRPKKVTT